MSPVSASSSPPTPQIAEEEVKDSPDPSSLAVSPAEPTAATTGTLQRSSKSKTATLTKGLVRSSSSKTAKTLIVASAITGIFVISFVPFFVLGFLNASRPVKLGRSLRGAALVIYDIFACFPFLNAMANPFIYGALNTAFRAQCVRVWRRATCRKTSKSSSMMDFSSSSRQSGSVSDS
jgi:hypothetical protein